MDKINLSILFKILLLATIAVAACIVFGAAKSSLKGINIEFQKIDSLSREDEYIPQWPPVKHRTHIPHESDAFCFTEDNCGQCWVKCDSGDEPRCISGKLEFVKFKEDDDNSDGSIGINKCTKFPKCFCDGKH